MATNKKSNRKRRRASPSVQGKSGATNSFRMVVAANPGSEITVAPELDLVKAALLYGDKVTLVSPVTTMFLRVEGLQRLSPLQLIQLVRRTAPVLLPADQVSDFENGIAQVDEVLRNTAGGRLLPSHLLRAILLQHFQPMQQELSGVIRTMGSEAGIDQLDKARAKGIVQVENIDPGDALDLLVSCIVSAKLAEKGQRQDDPHTDRIVDTFLEKLTRHLSSGREYFIFDQPIANLVEAAVREGIFTPAKGPAGRSAQAMAASALMGRLPTFPNATVDELLDIRTDLAPSLTQFRSAMVTISQTFKSAPWESDFEDALNDAWVETVHPAVEAIDASVRDNKSLLTLAAGAVGAANTSYPGLTIVAAGLLGHVGAVAAFGGAISGAGPALQALRDRKAAARDIRMQPFYFLYAVDQALR
jgi:hypothetical protein